MKRTLPLPSRNPSAVLLIAWAAFVLIFLVPVTPCPAAPDSLRAAADAVRATETARAAWLARYVTLGFTPREAEFLTKATLPFRAAPFFLADLETVLNKTQAGDERLEAVRDLLDGERGRALLSLAGQLEKLGDGERDLGSERRPPENWDEALHILRQREAALREADAWLDALPALADCYPDADLLRRLRRAEQQPGTLRRMAAVLGDDPFELSALVDTALAAPDHFAEQWTNRGQRDRYLRELAARTGLQASDEADKTALWELRDNEAALSSLADLAREAGWMPPLPEAVAMLSQGPDAFAAWRKQWLDQVLAANTALSRMRLCSRDTVTLPVAQFDPKEAQALEKLGSRPFRFTENAGARALLDSGQGVLPNGLTVSLAPYADIGHQALSFAEKAYVLTPHIPGDGGLGQSFGPWESTSRSEEVEAPLLLARLLRFSGEHSLLRLDIVLFSDRPAPEVAAHLGYLNRMVSAAQNPAADDPLGGAGHRRLPERAAADIRSGAPGPRLINFAGGSLFTALAEGLESDDVARLFGPLNAVCVPHWSPDPAGTGQDWPDAWLCLRPDVRGDFVGRALETPPPALPASCLPALNRRKAAIPPLAPSPDNLQTVLLHWGLDRVQADTNDSAALRAAYEDGVHLCDQAGIREPGDRDFAALLWTALRLGGRDAACQAMRTCLLREGVPLLARLRELPAYLVHADENLWPQAAAFEASCGDG